MTQKKTCFRGNFYGGIDEKRMRFNRIRSVDASSADNGVTPGEYQFGRFRAGYKTTGEHVRFPHSANDTTEETKPPRGNSFTNTTGTHQKSADTHPTSNSKLCKMANSNWIHAAFAAILVALICSSCSGAGVYDPDSELCCSGNVSQRSFGAASACCGDRVFDARHSICCTDEDTGVESAVPVPVDIRGEQIPASRFRCCGKTAYFPETQSCCNNEPLDKQFRNTGCCNRKSFDSDRFVCCGNATLVRRSPLVKGHKGILVTQKLSACCENQGYDPKKFMCCNGKIHRRWGSTAACCGQEAFDVGQEGCCGGAVYGDPFGILGCCGNTTYDALADICCEDVVSSDPLRVMACCGSRAYNVFQETCCGGAVVPKADNSSSASAIASCCGGVDQFDARKAICCGGVTVPLPSDGFFACCGKGTYDQHKDICCGDVVQQRQSEQTRCCGVEAYEKGEATCCGAILLPVGSTKMCCRGTAVEVPRNKLLCC